MWSDWLCRRWPSSWISTASIFPSQGAPRSNSQTGSLAQWCHQTADHGPERQQEGDYWHRSGCCALWHSGLADLWGWGDCALALGLGEEKVLAGFPLLTSSWKPRSQDARLTSALFRNATTPAFGWCHDQIGGSCANIRSGTKILLSSSARQQVAGWNIEIETRDAPQIA